MPQHQTMAAELGHGGVSLPEDIVFDVLSRLPARDLCRFRCVSKGWRALISEPAFVAAQKSRVGQPDPLLIGFFAPPDTETLDLQVMDMHGNVLRVVKNAFNDDAKLRRPRPRLDLACLDAERFGTGAVDPATWRVVPIGRYVNDPTAGDAGIRYSSYGRAAQSGVYKAVRLRETLCEVAMLEDGGGGAEDLAWRETSEPPFRLCGCSSCTTMVDGVIYFLPFYNDQHSHVPLAELDRNLVAALDIETESWRVTECPKEEVGFDVDLALAELKGTLSMVQSVKYYRYQNVFHGNCVNLWFLDDFEKGIWVKKYRIEEPRDTWFYFKPLEVLGDGRVLMLNRVTVKMVYTLWMLLLYDPSTDTLTDLAEISWELRDGMTIYKGSLLS